MQQESLIVETVRSDSLELAAAQLLVLPAQSHVFHVLPHQTVPLIVRQVSSG